MADSNPHQDTIDEVAKEYADFHGSDWHENYNAFLAGADWAFDEATRILNKIKEGEL